MQPTRRLGIVISLAPLVSGAFLGACSGGSGGGSGVSTEPVAITSDNAVEVAAGMPAAAALIGFQEFMSFQTLTSEGVGTFDCPDGGTITAGFDVDAAPVGVVSSGDRFEVTFAGCMLSVDTEIDGRIALDFDTITGDWEADDVWAVELDLTIDGLTFSAGSAGGFFDGSWSQSASFDMGDSAFALAGDFTTTFNGGSGLQVAALRDLVLSWAYDAVAGEATYSVDGLFASSALGGSVELATTTPFVLADGAPNPHAGAVRALGAGGSQLTFTVLDATFVQIDVDADGDGTDEFTLTTSWDELES
jgi:hypothetical protein